MSIVKRADRQHYMNTGTALSPVWSQIGEGFTEFKESKNAVSYQRRYINETSKRTDITGYAPEIDYETEIYSDSPAISKIRQITDRELTGDDAKVEIISVDTFEAAVSGAYSAIKRTYTVIPDEIGDGTDALCYTGTMKAAGELTIGRYNPTTGVFTAQ